MTTTGFTVEESTACDIIISGVKYTCSVATSTNSFVVDVTSLRLKPEVTTLSLHALTLTNSAADGAYFDARTCTASTCASNEIIDDFSEKSVFVQFKSGIKWAIGVDNLKWEPGVCLEMDIYVFGYVWSTSLDAKLSFKSAGTTMTTTGLRCNIFEEGEVRSSSKFKKCEVSSDEIIIVPNEQLASGESAHVMLCSSSVVPFVLAPNTFITVTG